MKFSRAGRSARSRPTPRWRATVHESGAPLNFGAMGPKRSSGTIRVTPEDLAGNGSGWRFAGTLPIDRQQRVWFSKAGGGRLPASGENYCDFRS